MMGRGPLLVLVITALAAGGPAVAAPASASQPRSIFVMDLEANHVDEATVDTIEGVIATELARERRLKVIAGDDLRRLLDLEAEKQAAGCDGDTSCLAEIAGALGAELVIMGQLGRLGSAYMLTLTLIDTTTAEALSRERIQVEKIGALPARLEAELPRLVRPAVEGVKQPINVVWPVLTTTGVFAGLLFGAAGLTVGVAMTALHGTTRGTLDLAVSEPGAKAERTAVLRDARAGYEWTIWMYNLVGVPSYWLGAGLLTLSAVSAMATVSMLVMDAE